MRPTSHFTAEILFHFNDIETYKIHGFKFGENLHRRVPMRMDGVDGLNTVGIWTTKPTTFNTGEIARFECAVISPEIFYEKAISGVSFDLWDGKFFVSGIVIESIESWARRSS